MYTCFWRFCVLGKGDKSIYVNTYIYPCSLHLFVDHLCLCQPVLLFWSVECSMYLSVKMLFISICRLSGGLIYHNLYIFVNLFAILFMSAIYYLFICLFCGNSECLYIYRSAILLECLSFDPISACLSIYVSAILLVCLSVYHSTCNFACQCLTFY